MDTAWPYKESVGAPNPYRFFVEVVSSAMQQRQIRATHMWERSTPEKEILDRVGTYIDAAFEKGAGSFVVTTQDTNYPDPLEVFRWAASRWREVSVIKVRDYSHAATKPYYNYWAFYAPKKKGRRHELRS